MYKLGASLYQAQAAINKFGNTGDDSYSTHPNKSKRLAAISRGYNKAKTEYDRYKVKTLTASDYFYRAYNAKEEDYQYKIDNYTKSIQLEPRSPSSYFNRCKIYWSLAKKNREDENLMFKYYEQAIKDINKAISVIKPTDKDNYVFFYARARMFDDLIVSGRKEKKEYYINQALKDYNAAIKLNKNSFDLYDSRGYFHLSWTKNFETAIDDFTKCVQLSKDSETKWNSYNRRINAYRSKGDYSAAIEDYTNLLKLPERKHSVGLEHAMCWRESAELNERIGNINEALRCYDMAIKASFKYKDTLYKWMNVPYDYYLKSELLLKQKDYSKAIEVYNDMLKLPHDIFSPNITWYPSVYAWRADAYLKLGDSIEALDDIKKAIDEAPNWAYPYKIRANYYYYDNRDYQKAILDYDKVLELDSKAFHIYFYRGVAKANLNDFNGAIEDYSKYISSSNKNKYLGYYNRGLAKKKLENYKGAIEDYSKSIELNPTFENSYYARAESKAILKDNHGAILDYTKVLELNPYDIDSYNNRGNKKYNLTDYEGAISDYSKAIELDNNYSSAYHNRAAAKKKKGVPFCDDYKKACELGYEESCVKIKTDCN